MLKSRAGVGKAVIIVALAIVVGASFLLMTQEQKARAACEEVNRTLGELIEAGESPTPEEVHELIKRQPHVTRNPGKHRLVEEYHWQGPFGKQTVYTYYTTAATKLLEAVSMNAPLEEWEGDDK